MKVLFASSEAYPFAMSGGLADVAGALPKALRKRFVGCRVVLPLYSSISDEMREKMTFVCSITVPVSWRRQYCGIFEAKYNGVIYYFLDNQYYFKRQGIYGHYDDAERFAFFSRAVLEMIPYIDFKPDVINCNDWQTGPLCAYLKEIYGHMMPYSKIKTLYTIHNLQYQGRFAPSTLDMMGLPGWTWNNVEFYDSVSFMKMGLVYCDYISTVSETYAYEIQTPEYGYGMEVRRNIGAVRGVQPAVWCGFGIFCRLCQHRLCPESAP